MTTASVYTGIFLGNESKEMLLDIVKRHLGELQANVRASSLTLRFRGNPDKIPAEMMGKRPSFSVIGIREEDGIQCAILKAVDPQTMEDLSWASYPHITISLRNGAKSSASKKLAKSFMEEGPREGDVTFEEGVVVVEGSIGFLHDRKGPVFTHLSPEEMIPTPR